MCDASLIFSLLLYSSRTLQVSRKNVPVKALADSRLSRKFQVTIPKDVRKLLRLDAGDLLVFVKDRRHVLLKRGEIKIER